MQQMMLPIQIDEQPSILGQPVDDIYTHNSLKIEVLGGKFAGGNLIYLNHFSRPLAHARHYLGSAKDIEHYKKREKAHSRKYPLFVITERDLRQLPDISLKEKLNSLQDRRFRRHHTFLKAVAMLIGKAQTEHYRFLLLRLAKKYDGSPLLMAANRNNIQWWTSRLILADRKFELYIKNTRKCALSTICPVCQGVDIPFF